MAVGTNTIHPPILPLMAPPKPSRPIKPVKAPKPSVIAIAMRGKRPR